MNKKYNVQFCLDTSPNSIPGISLGLFEEVKDAVLMTEAVESVLKHMNIPIEGHGNRVVWFEQEENNE